jgi:predicted ATPase/transcriptional regulator with XRE-family HTH domain
MEDRGRVLGSWDFGTLLRHYRLAARLSQEALAERAQMSVNGVSALERGYRRTPQRETLALLVSALALDDEQRREFEATAARSVLLGRGASVTVGPWADGATINLPLALSSFVGRDSELDEIATLVREHRMVTLTGVGGIGKTQTALRVTTALSAADDGAVCFVGLAPITNHSLVVAAIASALGVQEVPNRPLLDTLLAYLKKKSLLLILDNCEHVIGDAATVAGALLAGCPRLRILATSREPLRAAGEHTYRLASLNIPSPGASRRLGAVDAATYGAIVLFTDRARAVDHRFILTDENAPIVGELCRRLDGIPLAIELAAARVNQLPVESLAEELDDRFRILTGGERTALPRQQTMRAAIDWSYNLLSSQEQRVFERLSIFAGGYTFAAAATICGGEETADIDVFNVLSSLVEKSLVVVDLEGSDRRYRFLESFRQYACEKLAVRGELNIVAHRHARACLELAERFDHAYNFEPDEVWRALAQDEMDNWRAALQWALTDRRDVLLGQRLAGQLLGVWVYLPVEGRRWITLALALVDERTPTGALAELTYAASTVAWRLREYEVQLACSETAIARYGVVGDALGIARAQSLAGHALLYLGRIAEAKTRLQEAFLVTRRFSHQRLLAYILRCLGMASGLAGDPVGARGHMREALLIYQSLGAELGVANALFDLSEVEFYAGNSVLALQYAKEGLTANRTFDYAQTAGMLVNVAKYLLSLARHDEAKESAVEALELALERQLAAVAAWSLQYLATIAALRPDVGADRKTLTHAHTARVFGFVDARLMALGSANAVEQLEYDQVLVVLRDALGTDMVTALMVAGATMTEEQAVEEALAI